MMDIEKLQSEMERLNSEINPRILYDKLSYFYTFFSKIPEEVEIHCPISLQPQYYSPPGKPITLYISVLKEIKNWCDVQKNLAPIKCNQLFEPYTKSLENNQLLISFQSARAIMETTAFYKNEWIESKNKIGVIAKLKASSFNHASKNDEDFKNLLTKLFDLLRILRAVTQRSRYDWLGITHDVKPDLGDMSEDLIRQRNVLTAIGKIDIPETKYCKTTKDHYEMICDFVHPNRGANMLFVDKATADDEYLHHVFSKHPKSYELLCIAIEFTAIPLISCVDEIVNVYRRWSEFGEVIHKLINKIKFYEK